MQTRMMTFSVMLKSLPSWKVDSWNVETVAKLERLKRQRSGNKGEHIFFTLPLQKIFIKISRLVSHSGLESLSRNMTSTEKSGEKNQAEQRP